MPPKSFKGHQWAKVAAEELSGQQITQRDQTHPVQWTIMTASMTSTASSLLPLPLQTLLLQEPFAPPPSLPPFQECMIEEATTNPNPQPSRNKQTQVWCRFSLIVHATHDLKSVTNP
jgi:hypothetical protein